MMESKKNVLLWSGGDCLGEKNQEISVLHIYTEEIIIEKDTGTPVFITALFTIARIGKQPRCPLTDEWIKEDVHIYNGMLLSYETEHI